MRDKFISKVKHIYLTLIRNETRTTYLVSLISYLLTKLDRLKGKKKLCKPRKMFIGSQPIHNFVRQIISYKNGSQKNGNIKKFFFFVVKLI